MLEIKYRGPLTPTQIRNLIRFFSRKSKLIFAGLEKVLFLDTTIFPSIGDFNTGFSRISLKENGNLIRVRIKEGNPSDHKRKERSFSVRKKEMPQFLYFLTILGLHQGFYRPAYRRIYQWGPIRFSIKTKSVIGDHFEIELPSETAFSSPAVQEFLQQFDLQLWNKEMYQKRIATGMKTSPAVAITTTKFFD